ncbi:MAG: helix-turn-helix transcriptional regulator [Acidimicrobiia bacterium]
MIEKKQLLTVEDLAAMKGTQPAAIHAERHRHGTPRGVRLGRRLYFREEDVTRWLEGHAEPASA